jgi:hypothetical protein
VKRIRLISTAVVGATLFAFLNGCGKPNSQKTEARANRPRETSASALGVKSAEEVTDGQSNSPVGPALLNGTKPVGDSVEGQPSDAGTVALSDGPQPVDGLSAKTNFQSNFILPDGSIYEGEVIEGQPSGRGAITHWNGTHQQGEYRAGKMYRVSGTWIASDGTKEVGTWNFDGDKSGGTITWKDGRVYKGDWKIVENLPELPDGMGTMTWPDGRKYVGQFRNGTMEGTGKMTYPDGKITEGVWKRGEFVGAAK